MQYNSQAAGYTAAELCDAAQALPDVVLRATRPLVQNITNYVAMTISANVLLALGALTTQRNSVYASETAFWSDAAAKSPDNPRAAANLGYALALAGLQAERLASGQLRRAQRLAVGRGGAQADAAAVDLQVEQLQLAGGKVEVALAALAGSDLDAAVGQRHGLGGLSRGQQVEEKQQRGGNGRHGISLRRGAAIRAAHRKRRTITAEICRCDPG